MKTELARAFDLSSFELQLINVSENETYRIDCSDGRSFALRLNRPFYHTEAEIESEMAWLEALHAEHIIQAAVPRRGRNGRYLQNFSERSGILFDWQEGREPTINENLFALAEALGGIAAKLHNHVASWAKPIGFTRPRWDFAAALGAEMRWGDWRLGLGVSPDMIPIYSRAIAVIERRLRYFGEAPSRFNLIHGDLRLANLLVDGSAIKVIDFDDSGFGWLMYDAATMVSFHEHEPQVAELLDYWVKGYRSIRQLSASDEKEIATFIMFRRLLLTAWLGSHSEIDLAHSLRPSFAQQTADLCEIYLRQHS